jgi:hypothetical protein
VKGVGAGVVTAERVALRAMVQHIDSTLGRVLDQLERWHNDNHGTGRIDTCHEQPCRDVMRML